jgi:hypothetical protein
MILLCRGNSEQKISSARKYGEKRLKEAGQEGRGYQDELQGQSRIPPGLPTIQDRRGENAEDSLDAKELTICFDDLIDRPNCQLFGHREALHADHRPVCLFGL